MDYKEMIEVFTKNGGSEKKMWETVAITGEAMHYIKEVDPDKYDCLMRRLSESLYGKHYTKDFAMHEVSQFSYTDAAGTKHKGAHWTVEEVEAATAGKTFPTGTTKWDKYVAYNATYADFSKKFNDEQVLCAAYLFWFADEDWNGDGKIWDYMSIK